MEFKYRLIQECSLDELSQISDLLSRYDLALPDLRTTMFIVAEHDKEIVCVMCIKTITHLEPVAMRREVAPDIDWSKFYQIANSFMEAYQLPEYMIITPHPKIGQRVEGYGMKPVKGVAYIKVFPW